MLKLFARNVHQYPTLLFVEGKFLFLEIGECVTNFREKRCSGYRWWSSTTFIHPTISKAVEGFVFKWIFELILPHIARYQYGNIKKKCSTPLALIHMAHHWKAADSTSSVICSFMIEIFNDFTEIYHNILIKKLLALGDQPSWKLVQAGNPQGTKLRSLLFPVMNNDPRIYFPWYK